MASRRLVFVEAEPTRESTAAQTMAIEKPTRAASVVSMGATLCRRTIWTRAKAGKARAMPIPLGRFCRRRSGHRNSAVAASTMAQSA